MIRREAYSHYQELVKRWQSRPQREVTKDEKRIDDIIDKANGSKAKAMALTRQMANSITDADKAFGRGYAAQDMNYHDMAEVFFERADQLYSASDKPKPESWPLHYYSAQKKGATKEAMEFPTRDALEKYLEKHPGADRSNHTVKPHKVHEGQPGDSIDRTALGAVAKGMKHFRHNGTDYEVRGDGSYMPVNGGHWTKAKKTPESTLPPRTASGIAWPEMWGPTIKGAAQFPYITGHSDYHEIIALRRKTDDHEVDEVTPDYDEYSRVPNPNNFYLALHYKGARPSQGQIDKLIEEFLKSKGITKKAMELIPVTTKPPKCPTCHQPMIPTSKANTDYKCWNKDCTNPYYLVEAESDNKPVWMATPWGDARSKMKLWTPPKHASITGMDTDSSWAAWGPTIKEGAAEAQPLKMASDWDRLGVIVGNLEPEVFADMILSMKQALSKQGRFSLLVEARRLQAIGEQIENLLKKP